MAIFRRRSPLAQARRLHAAWLAAAHAERRHAHSSDTRAEERAWARLVAHVDAHGLSGGPLDPRGPQRTACSPPQQLREGERVDGGPRGHGVVEVDVHVAPTRRPRLHPPGPVVERGGVVAADVQLG